MVPTKWYSVASAYWPTNTQHLENNAQRVRIYKGITRVHRHAQRDAMFVAERDSGLGLVYSQDFYAGAGGYPFRCDYDRFATIWGRVPGRRGKWSTRSIPSKVGVVPRGVG